MNVLLGEWLTEMLFIGTVDSISIAEARAGLWSFG
jgi:hypothetical protein